MKLKDVHAGMFSLEESKELIRLCLETKSYLVKAENLSPNAERRRIMGVLDSVILKLVRRLEPEPEGKEENVKQTVLF